MTKQLLLILSILYTCVAFPQQWYPSPAPYGRDVNCLKIFNRDTIITAGGWHIVSTFQTEISPAVFKTNISGLGLWNVANIVDTNQNWIRSIDFTDNNNGIAVGWGGKIYTATDGGENWGAIASPINRDFNKIFFINTQVMLIAGGEHSDSVVGGTQTILKTINGGQTWNVVMDQPGYWLQSVYFINDTTGYAVGDSGTILKSVNGGDTWSPITSPIQRNLNAIWFADVNNGIIVGGNFSQDSIRTILRTANGGNTWTTQKDELGGMLRDVHFVNASTGYTVGDRATVLKTTDAGISWNPMVIPGTAGDEQLNVVRFNDPDFGWVAGKWGVQYIYNTVLAPEVQTTGVDVTDTAQITFNGLVNSHGENCVYSFLFSPDNFSTIVFETPYPNYIRSNSFMLAAYSIPPAWLMPDTSYGYLIKARTLGGTVYGDTFSFYIGNPESEIKTFSASGITGTSAILNGSVKGFSVPVNLYFEYGSTPQLGSQIPATPPSVTDTALRNVSANISSLQSNEIYYYRLKGVIGSTSYYGNVKTFYSGVPFSALETLQPTNILDSSAMLNGQVEGFKIPATISFEYSATNMTFQNTVSTNLSQFNDTLYHVVNSGIFGLTPATLYYYRLKAETSVGTFYGDTIGFYSRLTDYNWINTMPATDIIMSSAVLNGAIGGFSVPVSLSFEYGVTTAMGTVIAGTPGSINDTSTNTITATASGLQNNTIYFYRLKAEVASGAVFYGDIRQFYTGNTGIPNWDFQHWKRDTILLANAWNVLGDDFERVPGHSGNYALKVSRSSIAVLGLIYDSGADALGFLRGVPFNHRPDSISVYLNYFVQPGDSAYIIAHLYDDAFNDISTTLFLIGGNSGGTFTRVTFPITYNSSLMPDSLVVAFLPASFEGNNSTSYLIIDDIAGVPSSPMIYNGNLEQWFAYSSNFLLSWSYIKDALVDPQNIIENPLVVQSLFNSPDDYAAELNNFSFGNGLWGGAEISNKSGISDKAYGGFPVSARHQSLNGYFKWFPVNGDSMLIDVQMRALGQLVGTGQFVGGSSVTAFTTFDIPITYTTATAIPDTATIIIKSFFKSPPKGPSRLVIDKLSFDGFAGAEEITGSHSEELSEMIVFPNPATSVVTIQMEKGVEGVLEIFNLHGIRMYADDFSGNKVDVNTSDFPKGLYIVQITQGAKRLANKFMVIRF